LSTVIAFIEKKLKEMQVQTPLPTPVQAPAKAIRLTEFDENGLSPYQDKAKYHFHENPCPWRHGFS
jgi:hypothetical protein